VKTSGFRRSAGSGRPRAGTAAPFKKEFFSGRSMREGYSITDDDKVVAVTSATPDP
jgi:hypothetical protein